MANYKKRKYKNKTPNCLFCVNKDVNKRFKKGFEKGLAFELSLS